VLEQAPTLPKPAPPTKRAVNENAALRLATGEEPPAKTPTLTVRNQVMPQLPEVAKALGIVSGHVAVVLHVNPRGTVDRVELLSATPPQVYDAAMELAFRQWTFDPLGIPGRMTVEVEVTPGPSR
jgi:TonB family protein